MLKSLGIFKDHVDGTIKQVFSTEANNIIEITLINNKEGIDVICVPTHHFCNLGCKMCHLTNNKLNKEMKKICVDDLLEAIKKILLKYNTKRRKNNDKLLISYMGVGEPLLNIELIYDVFKCERELKKILGYSYISYALSTMMPNRNLEKLTRLCLMDNIPLKIHFSLHSPIDKERQELLPSSCVNINEAFEMLCQYRYAINGNDIIVNNLKKFHQNEDCIELHYTLIEGVNDEDRHLEMLKYFEKKYRIPIKFILFNPTNNMKRSSKVDHWIESLKETITNLYIVKYAPPGREIGSSCGEFTKHYYHEEIETIEQKIEFENWKKSHIIDE